MLQHPTPVQQHHQRSFKYSQLATTLASSSISKIMEETVYKMYLQLQDYMHWAENHAELSLLNSNLPRLLSLHLKHQKPCINLDISGVQQTAVTLTNRRLVHPSEIFALFYGVFFHKESNFAALCYDCFIIKPQSHKRQDFCCTPLQNKQVHNQQRLHAGTLTLWK